MNIHLLETHNLTKTYNKINVIDKVNLKINKGEICGLIGQNGAGKTTLIRMFAGLIFPTSGKISIHGNTDSKYLSKHRKKMSFIVETPYIMPTMTAYENMEFQRIQRGVCDSNQTKKLLKFAGLNDTGLKAAEHFSLGMRQRLGIAIALLNDPEFIFLDEPLNGLDPEGIIQMRDFLRKLNSDRNITILISSHLLSELYQVATNYIILDNGKIIDQLSMNELNEQCSDYLYLGVTDSESAADLLRTAFGFSMIKIETSNYLRIYDVPSSLENISKILIENGVLINHFEKRKKTLEQFYIEKIYQDKVKN